MDMIRPTTRVASKDHVWEFEFIVDVSSREIPCQYEGTKSKGFA
jgi:hypothetical protein